MGYERYPRNTNPQADFYGQQDQDYGRDYGSGRDYGYSSARDYQAAGELGDDRGGYGRRDRTDDRYGQRAQMNRSRGQGPQRYGSDEYHGSYASDGRRFEDVGRRTHADDDNYRPQGYRQQQGRGYGRQPQGYDYEERGFFQRAGDEVRSWFGDEDAERRREADARFEDRYNNERDADYHGWRRSQIAAFDRDYDEYRQENRSKFENEFHSWRNERQTQRSSLSKVEEHMEVVGSDGAHVGTVDKVRGDRILLTKNDTDAGGRHHSIPSRWITSVDTKVTVSKTADEAKAHWKDEERNQAMFGDEAQSSADQTGRSDAQRGGLNRSFSGTY